MADFKAMYYHLAGRMSVAVDILDATIETMSAATAALAKLSESLKSSQQITEEMFISCEDDDGENNA